MNTAKGGGVNASQTVSLNRTCQNLILKSACLPEVRENVLVPILDYLANDANPKLTLKNDPIKVLWLLLRQGAFMCELLNQVQPGIIQSVSLPISPMGANNFTDANSRQNVAAFVKASRNMFFMTDDQLFNPGDLYKEDFITFSKALSLCETYMNNKIRVSSRNSYVLSDQNFDNDILYLFDVKGLGLGKVKEEDEENEEDKKSEGVPVKSKREKILEEMIASERVYVEDLTRLHRYKELIKFERLLSQKTIDLIFSNLKDLLNFQRKFMIEMEDQMQKEKPDLASLFTAHEADFSLYEEFCLNQSEALVTLADNKAILDSKADSLENIGDVSGYLIKPIQRVPRYSLFLRDLAKDARKRGNEEEAKNAEIAAESAKRIANRINERQRAAENEKASALFFSIVKLASPEKMGKLILHDYSMRMKLDGVNKVYQVFLFQRKMVMCALKNEAIGPFWLKNRISIDSIKDVQEVPSNDIQNPFEAEITCTISGKNVVFSLIFNTQQTKRMWINAIRNLAELPPLVYEEGKTIDELSVIPEAEEKVKADVSDMVKEPRGEMICVVNTRIRVLFREEYFSFIIEGSGDISLVNLCEMVRSEIYKAYSLEFQNTSDLPSIGRVRLRFKDSDGVLVRLSNDQVISSILKDKSGGVIDLILYESEPVRVRFTYRECMYSFLVDDISSVEELKMYIYETIAEDYKMIKANVEAIPKGDDMRIYFKEKDGEWTLILYDNDLEVALKETNRKIDLKL
jgi:hypothetical protein